MIKNENGEDSELYESHIPREHCNTPGTYLDQVCLWYEEEIMKYNWMNGYLTFRKYRWIDYQNWIREVLPFNPRADNILPSTLTSNSDSISNSMVPIRLESKGRIS